jgi:hypothetical protein
MFVADVSVGTPNPAEAKVFAVTDPVNLILPSTFEFGLIPA